MAHKPIRKRTRRVRNVNNSVEIITQNIKELRRQLLPLSRERFRFDHLLLLAAFTCPPSRREIVLGDLVERYIRDCKRWNPTKAKWLMARDIVVTIMPVIRDIAHSKIARVFKYMGIVEMVRRYLG
jgi:hypothetical protein